MRTLGDLATELKAIVGASRAIGPGGRKGLVGTASLRYSPKSRGVLIQCYLVRFNVQKKAPFSFVDSYLTGRMADAAGI